MSDAAPDTLSPAPLPPDRRIVLTAAVSVALHLMVLGALLLPRTQLHEPTEPPAVNVDLVPTPEASRTPPVSSAPPSSEMASSAAPSSAEPVSSAAPSSAEAVSSAAASEEPASSASEASSQEAERAKPVVIPVGPSAASSDAASSAEEASASDEPSSAASEASSVEASSAEEETAPSELTAAGAGDEGAAEAAPAAEAPPIKGALHVAKRFYLAAMLDTPAMARAREAIKRLPREKRLVQTCNIEAVGQLGNAGRGFDPDALIADALAKPVAADSSFTVTGGAFRSNGRWRALAYACTLSPDLDAIVSFSWRVGDDVTALLVSRLGG